MALVTILDLSLLHLRLSIPDFHFLNALVFSRNFKDQNEWRIISRTLKIQRFSRCVRPLVINQPSFYFRHLCISQSRKQLFPLLSLSAPVVPLQRKQERFRLWFYCGLSLHFAARMKSQFTKIYWELPNTQNHYWPSKSTSGILGWTSLRSYRQSEGKKRGKKHECKKLLGFTLTFDWPTRWHEFFQPIKKLATFHHNNLRNQTRQRNEYGKPCVTSVAMICLEKKFRQTPPSTQQF